MKELIIDKNNSNQRVDKFVKKYLNDAPLSFIYKLFRKKDVKINGHWCKLDAVLKENDVLRIYITDEQFSEFQGLTSIEKIPFDFEIIYEDDNILVINKKQGLLVHEDEKEKTHTLANEVLSYLFSKGEYKNGDVFKASPAHRLDRNTSGVIFFGKNVEALQKLMELFKEKNQIEKHYLGLCVGVMPREGLIDKPLLKDADNNLVKVVSKNNPLGKTAVTRFRVVTQFSDCALVNIQILTGRTHQIRVHLASIDHPIVGDAKYGDFEFNRSFEKHYGISTQFLHSYSIKFGTVDGVLSYLSGKEFTAKLPKNLDNILQQLS